MLKYDDEQLKCFITEQIANMKGKDTAIINVKNKSSIIDIMIICTGTSSRHVGAIAENLVHASRKIGVYPLSVEGQKWADWVIVDFGNIAVHVMQEASRQYYQLEKLWS